MLRREFIVGAAAFAFSSRSYRALAQQVGAARRADRRPDLQHPRARSEHASISRKLSPTWLCRWPEREYRIPVRSRSAGAASRTRRGTGSKQTRRYLFALGGDVATHAAKATQSIPIVYAMSVAAINAVAAEFSNARRRNWASRSCRSAIRSARRSAASSRRRRSRLALRGLACSSSAPRHARVHPARVLLRARVRALARAQAAAGAIAKINSTLKRLGHSTIAALPAVSADVRKRSVSDIFSPAFVAITVLVTAAYFFHITTFYFIVKWVPKIVVDLGFAPSSAGNVLSWTNVGGATRRHRRRPARSALQRQAHHDRRDARVDDHGYAVRPHSPRSREAVDDLRGRGLLHERRDHRHVCDFRAGRSRRTCARRARASPSASAAAAPCSRRSSRASCSKRTCSCRPSP